MWYSVIHCVESIYEAWQKMEYSKLAVQVILKQSIRSDLIRGESWFERSKQNAGFCYAS
jgi:hypothetical protein